MDFQTVSFDVDSNELIIIDQTLLPNEEVFLKLSDVEEIREAIYNLRVRGAPAIGVSAAIGMAVVAQKMDESGYDKFFEQYKYANDILKGSRPTAVNLFWALNRMMKLVETDKGKDIAEIKKDLVDEALRIKNNDIAVCRKIGENGATLLQDGDTVLTHCNAGRLAAVKYGTALAPIYVAHEDGKKVSVYADETRPLLQGARLTAWELNKAGVDVTLICDSMASMVMKSGKINAVFVGADRIAKNGDTANKIGTSGVAILAHHYGVPFYVCAPMSTIDCKCVSGDDIQIENRSSNEITDLWYEKKMSPVGVKAFNPAFDVTPNEFITAIITQDGIIYPPFDFKCNGV